MSTVKTVYYVQDLNNRIIFEGNTIQICEFLHATQNTINKARNEGKLVNGKYYILFEKEQPITKKFNNRSHLYTEKGERSYEQKKGCPNRYKDASCVRFTPL